MLLFLCKYCDIVDIRRDKGYKGVSIMDPDQTVTKQVDFHQHGFPSTCCHIPVVLVSDFLLLNNLKDPFARVGNIKRSVEQ